MVELLTLFWLFNTSQPAQSILRRLVKETGRKVFLIVDWHPAHRSRKVREWLETNRDHIEMFFLPGYSPDLNPDEMLNQGVKTNAAGKRRPRSQKQLMRTVRNYLDDRRRDPERVKRYFREIGDRLFFRLHFPPRGFQNPLMARFARVVLTDLPCHVTQPNRITCPESKVSPQCQKLGRGRMIPLRRSEGYRFPGSLMFLCDSILCQSP